MAIFDAILNKRHMQHWDKIHIQNLRSVLQHAHI